MYSKANEWIKEEFIENNKVKSAMYKNNDYNPELIYDEENWNKKYYVDEDAPETRTFVINDENTFKDIFKEKAIKIDFEKRDGYIIYVLRYLFF